MRSFGLAAVLAGATFGVVGGQEKDAPVTVAWHGQSFFTVKSGKGTVVAFDPHQMMQYGRVDGLKADVACVSHLHNDHMALFTFENAKQVKSLVGLTGAGARTQWKAIDETVAGVKFRTVATYHDDREGLVRGKNAVFLAEIDGWRFCHLGDLGHTLAPEQVKAIGEVDVLMIPVGGIYTINGADAKKVVEQIRPKEYVFPMHYATKVFDELLPIDEFLEDQLRANVAISDDNRVALNKDAQRPRPLIVQLHYQAKAK